MSNPKSVHVCCGHCNGTGVREMAGVYAEALLMLRRHRKPIHGAELARMAGIKGPTMSKRLAILGEMGLAASHVSGRRRLWSVAQPASSVKEVP